MHSAEKRAFRGSGEASSIYAYARDPLKRARELAVTVWDSNQRRGSVLTNWTTSPQTHKNDSPLLAQPLQCLALPSTSFDVTGHRSRHSLIDASRSGFTRMVSAT